MSRCLHPDSTSPGVRGVRLGARTVGDAVICVIAGPAGGPDVAWTSLRRHHGAVDAAAELGRVRAGHAGPLVVEPFSADDLPAIAAYADGVVVGAAWMQDFRLLRAVARLGLPVIVQRGPHACLDEWLAAAEYCRVEGNRAVILCESGSRTHVERPALDLALAVEARSRSGLPVIVDVRTAPHLAGAALAAGADGLLLAEDADPAEVARVREVVATVGTLVRPARPGSLPAARAAIDRVDALLATVLERRALLAGTVQRLKPVGGFAGRDPDRERQVVAAMAARAPRLGLDRIRRIMTAVIEAGLEVAEAELAAATPPPETPPACGESPRGGPTPAACPAGGATAGQASAAAEGHQPVPGANGRQRDIRSVAPRGVGRAR